MMDPPKALLEVSFLHAVAEPGHPDHDRATDEYLRLVGRYQRDEALLVAVSTHLQRFLDADSPLRQIGLRRSGVFAPVDTLSVGFQHERVARRAAALQGLDLDTALTLTMAERHRIHYLVTLDPRFDAFELTILPRAAEPALEPASDVITDSIVDS